MSATEIPMGVALVVCDQIITEAGTNKKSLIGTFNCINSVAFPCVHPLLCIFVAMTGGNGSFQALLRCTNDAEPQNGPVFGASGPVNFLNPLETVEIGFRFVNVPFVKPGRYCIELFCGESLILTKRFDVKLLEQKK